MSHMNTTTNIGAGSLLGGRYRLGDRIASGGMATVFRGTDLTLGRDVAVKVMHPALAHDPGFVERFRREAQHAARLNHPNVVTVHDCGEQDDTLYIVMELVEGTSLRQLLERFGKLDADTVRHMVSGVGAALDHAHQKGLVHRDVKPENVLVTADGRVKVVDFGVAKALAEEGSRITGEHAVGTMSYIAPEQLTAGEVDARADVYALGVMTYEMLTGRPPFEGDTPAAVAAARLGRSVPSPGASPEADAAVAKATALDPADRFETAGEFSRSLGDAGAPTHLRETVQVARPVPNLPTTILPVPEAAPKRRRLPFAGARSGRRRWPWVALVLALLAAAGTGYALYPRTAAVPEVAGMTLEGAEAALAEAGLELGARSEAYDERVPSGRVLRSDPRPSEVLDRGAAVSVVLSKGPKPIAVPQVTGQPREEAEAALTEAGFAVGGVTEQFHETAPGTVVAQDPATGEFRRGTPVALVVSKGPEMIEVPSVAGRTPGQAEAALSERGFAPVRVEAYSDEVPEGTVIGSDPAGGRSAPKGSKVTYSVSKGPKPFPMPNLVGMSLEDAKAKARSLGLEVANAYAVPGSGKPRGQVQGQNPPAGTEVRRGARVDLYYAA